MRARRHGRHSRPGIVMVAAMTGAVAAMVWVAVTPTRFSATATAFVSTQSPTTLQDLGEAGDLAQQVRSSYASLATTPVVLRPVIQRLGLDTTPEALAQRITVDGPVDTSTLAVSVADTAPARAAQIADEVVRGLASASSTLQPQAAGPTSTHVTVISRARVPTSPVGPALPLAVLLGLLAGAGAGALGLLVRWAVQHRPPPGSGGLFAPSMLRGI